MSKKNRKGTPEVEDFKPAEYYKLKTQAVNDLVNANKENSPKVPEKEIRKYKSGPKIKVAEWLKMFFVKWWFAGCVCYFLLWGLQLRSTVDIIVIVGVVLGMVNDILVNNALRYLESAPGVSAKFMMFHKKGYYSFPLNILYSVFVFFLEFQLYEKVNEALVALNGAEAGGASSVPLAVEPIIFGLFYLIIDMIFVWMKNVFLKILADAKKKAVR